MLFLMWKKLALRGNTRNKKGGEELSYFNGGFGYLIEQMMHQFTKMVVRCAWVLRSLVLKQIIK